MSEALWFSDAAREQILAIDPQTGEVVHEIRCPEVRTGLTKIGQYLLQVVGSARSLRVLDPNTSEMVEEFDNPRPDGFLCGIEATRDGLWMGYRNPPMLDLRSWPDLGLIESIQVNQDVAGVTVIDHFVAFANYPMGRINLLDPVTKQADIAIGVDGNPTGLTWDGRWIWYCDYTNVQLRAIEVPRIVGEE